MEIETDSAALVADVQSQCPAITIGDAFLLIGDGIKIAKKAERMPGVKKLHQESDNSSKPPYIFRHHFGVLGLLVGCTKKMFCVPLICVLTFFGSQLRARFALI
ncbi:hypothetical protein [Desulfotruncus arcticus]|uniref:hypothetical protein n=1 Tax=Desulfotruncus arcticus TaxID=341036 RepID=UPI000ABD1F32|nr:hypothetical protein [Desulfotruncus arcticus]